MSQSVKIEGSLLAKNTVLNFIGQVVPLFVAVITIPFIIQGLGADRFGILSLAWIIIGYFSILNLGLGRATTKFVAEALGKDEMEKIPAIVWTSLASQLFLGILGGVILIILTPILVKQILNIPIDLIKETKTTFYLLSLSIPVVICSASLRGVLEAAQRFDLVNAIKIPSSCLNFLLPLIGVFLGFRLPGIIILLLISRIGTMMAYLILCFHVYPKIRKVFLINIQFFRPLFSFGGWITICNILIPILVYLDRFFIGTVCPIAYVGYYSVCYDVLSRLGIFPGSFAMTLFPAFSTLESNKYKLKCLYVCSLKYMLLIMGPIILVLVIFAGDILHLWLGSNWASKTTLVFQILAVGIFLNALAQMPANLLDGIGRPDLRAKIFLSYVLPYVALLWFLIIKFGIIGAALAWALRACLELILFFGIVWKIMGLNRAILIENGLLRGVTVYGGIIIMASSTIAVLGKTLLVRGITTAICLILFVLITWRYILDIGDKHTLFLTVSRLGK